MHLCYYVHCYNLQEATEIKNGVSQQCYVFCGTPFVFLILFCNQKACQQWYYTAHESPMQFGFSFGAFNNFIFTEA